jgi:hypothetical protein
MMQAIEQSDIWEREECARQREPEQNPIDGIFG